MFGGWTSASRKAMLPVFERFQALLWYPVQFEGNECSPEHHVFRRAAQSADPAGADMGEEKGYKSDFLLGSDYVFPRTANYILKKHIAHAATVVGEEYVPAGRHRFQRRDRQDQAGQAATSSSNTLNGDSNVSFFKQMAAAGCRRRKLPVMSFSIAEQEAQAMGPSLVSRKLCGAGIISRACRTG